MNVDMDAVVLGPVSTVLGDVQSEVRGVDAMHVVSNGVPKANRLWKRTKFDVRVGAGIEIFDCGSGLPVRIGCPKRLVSTLPVRP